MARFLARVLLFYSFYSTSYAIFTISADNVTVPYKGTAKLTCSVSINATYPDADVLFNILQRSPPLERKVLNYTVSGQSNEVVIIRSQTLTINQVLLSDTGSFMCSVTVKMEGYQESQIVSFSLSISNYYELILSISAPNVTVSFNDPAVLTCTVQANETAVTATGSAVDISINKTGNSSPLSSHIVEDISMFSKALRIDKAQINDSSSYQCSVRIGEEEEVRNFHLTFNDVVMVNQPLTDVQKSLGESLQLECGFSPVATAITWQRNGVDVKSNEAIITNNKNTGRSVLSLSNLNFYHMAEYKCIGTFLNSSDVTKADITIEEYEQPFIVDDYETEVNSQDTTVLECAVKGNPTPSYSWKGGNPLVDITSDSNAEGPYVTADGRLNLEQALERDTGVYFCYGTDNISLITVEAVYTIIIGKSGSSDDGQQLLIIIIPIIAVVTVIILCIIGIYFLIKNRDICFQSEEMKMDKAEAKIRRKKHYNARSLFDPEFGTYYDAYDFEYEESEEEEEYMEMTLKETGFTTGHMEEEEEKTKKRKKKKKKKGNFAVQQESSRQSHEDNEEITDFRQLKHEDDFSDDELPPQEHKKIGNRKLKGSPPPSTKADTTNVYDDPDDLGLEDEQQLATNGESQKPPKPSSFSKSGKIRRTSIKSSAKPKLKKKVSMGSVEILDDESGTMTPKRVEFNDSRDKELDKLDDEQHETIGKTLDAVFDLSTDFGEEPSKLSTTADDHVTEELDQLGSLAGKPPPNKRKLKRRPTPYELPTFDLPAHDDIDITPAENFSKGSLQRRNSLPSRPAKGIFNFRDRGRTSSFKEARNETTSSKRTEKKKAISSSYGAGTVDVFY